MSMRYPERKLNLQVEVTVERMQEKQRQNPADRDAHDRVNFNRYRGRSQSRPYQRNKRQRKKKGEEQKKRNNRSGQEKKNKEQIGRKKSRKIRRKNRWLVKRKQSWRRRMSLKKLQMNPTLNQNLLSLVAISHSMKWEFLLHAMTGLWMYPSLPSIR